MTSDKASSADNQQERLKTIGWIVGFIDGEGCFSVSIFRNHTLKQKWQVFPELIVSQEEKSLSTLRKIQKFFHCGNIFINRSTRKNDNHREPLYRYCVRSRKDLKEKIIPFFLENSLKTAKWKDFKNFIRILDLMDKKEHLSKNGLIKIAKIVEKMNQQKPSRFLESSETIR